MANSVNFSGLVKANSKGEYDTKVYGVRNYGGWFVKVTNDEGQFMTNMQIRTESERLAKQIKDARNKIVDMHGFIKTVNVAPSTKDPKTGEWVRGEADWRIFFYVESIADVIEPEGEGNPYAE
jgi:hypothetical protein